MDMSVQNGSQVVGKDGEVLLNEGPCSVVALPKNAAQTLPTPYNAPTLLPDEHVAALRAWISAGVADD